MLNEDAVPETNLDGEAQGRTYSPKRNVELEEEKEFGGTLAGIPLPREPFYPLRQDQFLTFRDGEMSEARAVRDASLSIFVAAAVGISGLVALIKWDSPMTEQKVAIGATAILCIGAVAALVVALYQQRQITRTRMRSAYSRLVATIENYFQLPAVEPTSVWSRVSGLFRRIEPKGK